MNFLKKIRHIILLFGIVILVMGLVDYSKISSLESKGETIQGKVSSRHILNTGLGRASYKLVIDYQPSRKIIYRKEFTVSKKLYYDTEKLDQVDIKYLKVEPEVSGISGNITEQKHPLYVGLGAFTFCLVVFFVLRLKDKRHTQSKTKEDHSRITDAVDDKKLIDEKDDSVIYSDEIDLKISESMELELAGEECVISKHISSKDWEQDDILKSVSFKSETFLHPQVFLDLFCKIKSRYLKDESQTFLKKVLDTNWFKFRFMDDSRTYPSINIDDKEILIRCHYLCPVFYLGEIDKQLFLVCEDLYDENMDEIPRIMCKLEDDSIFSTSSAVYDDEEELWMQSD